ncbi:hypothetical protein GPA10_13340 [Streptomyces sp. p1417]|uniref:DUF2530 domain-containing protein n=1 Tax=Streptomyces typhae TaxID=2681492 RepID=A0A6L6WUH7_9ACTN|nr:hypothetical protein [Streptomyces typhae]MVO85713.1 hypothetical protein [Streptomyces typhae]
MRHTAATVFGFAAWWLALGVLWLLLVGPVDGLELVVGAGVGLLGAVAARAARHAVDDR